MEALARLRRASVDGSPPDFQPASDLGFADVQEGSDGLWEIAPGRGRKPTYGSEKVASIIDATLRTKPKAMTQWSCRLMAASQGVSKLTINNIWQSHNLKPHRVKTFQLSRTPNSWRS